MNKTLRFAAIMLFGLLSTLTYAQQEARFDFSGDKNYELFGLAGQSAKDVNDGDFTEEKAAKVADITITVSPATGKNPNRMWKGSLRMYDGTMKIASSNGNISRIEFVTVNNKWGNNSVNVGTLTETTWQGDAAEVIMTVGSNSQMKEIVVTYANGGSQTTVAAPMITGEERFENTTLVTIQAQEGAQIYYTIDGQDPDDRSTMYTMPFTIDKTTTVKAVAVFNGKTSEIASKDFQKIDVVRVNSIAAFRALEPGTKAVLNLVNAQVVYKWTSNNGNVSIYVRDNSGAIMFYNPGDDLGVDEILNGEVYATYELYGILPQAKLVEGTNFSKLNVVAGNGSPTKKMEIADVANNLCDLVEVSGVTISEEQSGKYTNYYINKNGEKLQIFNGFHISQYDNEKLAALDKTVTYTIVGISSAYKKNHQINIISLTPEATNIDGVVATTFSNDAVMYNLAGQKVNNNYKGVVIVNGKKFVKK